MIQVKNNLTGAVALFKTLTQAFKFFCLIIKTININKYEKKEFFYRFKKNKRVKVGFGNISIVVSEADTIKTPKK